MDLILMILKLVHSNNITHSISVEEVIIHLLILGVEMVFLLVLQEDSPFIFKK
jgi:hypothetical protein